MAALFTGLRRFRLSRLAGARFSTDSLVSESPIQHLQRNARAYSLLAAPFGLLLAFGLRVESSLKSDMQSMKAEIHRDIARVETDIGRIEVTLQHLHKDVGELKGLLTKNVA